MLAIVDRVLLALVGLALFLGAGAVLAVGLGVPAPSWWIHDGPHDVLLDDAERTRWREADWWWPTVIVGLLVVLSLALWWAVAVVRRHRPAAVPLDTGDGGEASVRGRALESVLAEETSRLDGVDRADVLLTGSAEEPGATIRLRVDPRVDPADALDALARRVLEPARESTGLATLRARVRVGSSGIAADRVE
ncbi:alkaline shock response membrane anchor protein AmaP [Streptomyces sp. ZYX-F-203]